jgi:hypothetical protein
VNGAGIQSGAQRQGIFLLVLHRKLIRAPDNSKNSKNGAAGASDWDSVHLQKFSPKQHLHEPRSGILVWGYDKCCRKSISLAQLTEKTAYAETRKSKNSTRKRNFKSKLTRSAMGSNVRSID